MQVMTFDSWADFVRPLVHATPVRSSLYFFSFIVLCSLMCEFMMSAVFTDTLIEIRQEEVVQRRNAHRKWLAHVKRYAAQLFTIADEDGERVARSSGRSCAFCSSYRSGRRSSTATSRSRTTRSPR